MDLKRNLLALFWTIFPPDSQIERFFRTQCGRKYRKKIKKTFIRRSGIPKSNNSGKPYIRTDNQILT